MNRFRSAFGDRMGLQVGRTRFSRLRVESLVDRITPTVVVNGTPGDDVITTRLVVPPGSIDPRAARILVNGVVRATVRVAVSSHQPATIYYLAEPLAVNGGAGDDRIELGDVQSRSVSGGPGNDTLVGGNGRDLLVGGPGADDLSGGLENDALVADTDDVRVVGGGGEDSLVMTGIRGTVVVTPTTLTLNGRTLTEADGTYSGFESADLSASVTDDTLTATGFTGPVSLNGGGGNDTLAATGLSRARLFGGGGNDRLQTDADTEPLLFGGSGNDTLVGGPGQDWMDGGPGDDVLFGGDDQFPDWAVNRLYGGPGDDVLNGGTKADVLLGGRGNDHLFGGAGADWLYGEQGDDSLSGGDGNDSLEGDGPEPVFVGFGPGPGYGYARDYHYIGADDLDGGAGDDHLSGDRADTRLDGGAGANSVGVGRIRGTAVLTDTSLTINRRPVAVGGLTSVSMGGSPVTDDVLDATGFTGFVSLGGLGGSDTLLAGSGGSSLDGGPGADDLEGGPGDDTFHADVRDRHIQGGGGFDRVEVYSVSGSAVLTDTSLTINGRRIALGGMEGALLAAVGEYSGAPTTNDRLDASGFSGWAELVGGPGNDTLIAGSGGSFLDGQDGADVLLGGPGNDTLDGGAGGDTLRGGPGADTFVPDADAAIAAEEKARSDYNPAEGDTGY